MEREQDGAQADQVQRLKEQLKTRNVVEGLQEQVQQQDDTAEGVEVENDGLRLSVKLLATRGQEFAASLAAAAATIQPRVLGGRTATRETVRPSTETRTAQSSEDHLSLVCQMPIAIQPLSGYGFFKPINNVGRWVWKQALAAERPDRAHQRSQFDRASTVDGLSGNFREPRYVGMETPSTTPLVFGHTREDEAWADSEFIPDDEPL